MIAQTQFTALFFALIFNHSPAFPRTLDMLSFPERKFIHFNPPFKLEHNARSSSSIFALVIFALRWLLCLISIPACCRRLTVVARKKSLRCRNRRRRNHIARCRRCRASSLTNEFIIAAGNERTQRRLHGSNEYGQCMPRNSSSSKYDLIHLFQGQKIT